MSSTILQQVVNGLMAGSVYSLLALGLTLIFGVLNLLQMAHGEVVVAGAFAVTFAMVSWNLPFPIALVLGIIASAVIGLLIEALVVRPLLYNRRRKPEHLSLLIATIGVSLFLRNLGVRLFESQPQFVPDAFALQRFDIAGVIISNKQVLVLAVTLLLAVLLGLFVQRTKAGKAIRAVAENAEIASTLGIDPRMVVLVTIMIASAVGSVGGALFATLYNTISPFSGLTLSLKGLVAMLLGGVGSMTGAFLSGLILGVAESVAVGFISSSWRDAIAFGVMVIILLVRPNGLMGRAIDVQRRV